MPKITHKYDCKNDFRKKNGTVIMQKAIALMKANILSVLLATRPVAQSTFTLASWKFRAAKIQKKEDAIYGKRNLSLRALARPIMPAYTKNTVAEKTRPMMSSNLKLDIIKNLTVGLSGAAGALLRQDLAHSAVKNERNCSPRPTEASC